MPPWCGCGQAGSWGRMRWRFRCGQHPSLPRAPAPTAPAGGEQVLLEDADHELGPLTVPVHAGPDEVREAVTRAFGGAEVRATAAGCGLRSGLTASRGGGSLQGLPSKGRMRLRQWTGGRPGRVLREGLSVSEALETRRDGARVVVQRTAVEERFTGDHMLLSVQQWDPASGVLGAGVEIAARRAASFAELKQQLSAWCGVPAEHLVIGADTAHDRAQRRPRLGTDRGAVPPAPASQAMGVAALRPAKHPFLGLE